MVVTKLYRDSLSVYNGFNISNGCYDSNDILIIDKAVKNNYSHDEYIKMFWVGLMDGDGSIQVNH